MMPRMYDLVHSWVPDTTPTLPGMYDFVHTSLNYVLDPIRRDHLNIVAVYENRTIVCGWGTRMQRPLQFFSMVLECWHVPDGNCTT